MADMVIDISADVSTAFDIWMGLNSEDMCSKTEVVVGLGTKMKTNKTKPKEKQFENVKW